MLKDPTENKTENPSTNTEIIENEPLSETKKNENQSLSTSAKIFHKMRAHFDMRSARAGGYFSAIAGSIIAGAGSTSLTSSIPLRVLSCFSGGFFFGLTACMVCGFAECVCEACQDTCKNTCRKIEITHETDPLLTSPTMKK